MKEVIKQREAMSIAMLDKPMHPHASPSQMYHSHVSFSFISEEEVKEYDDKYRAARIGHMTTGEQENAANHIYKLILMKRRMRAKLNKNKNKK